MLFLLKLCEVRIVSLVMFFFEVWVYRVWEFFVCLFIRKLLKFIFWKVKLLSFVVIDVCVVMLFVFLFVWVFVLELSVWSVDSFLWNFE